jgi:glycosyltransferase involved in cell wall biosynthesis
MLPVYPLFVQGFRKADAIQAISTFLANWGKEMGFRGDVKVIPNAVDTAHFSREYPAAELEPLEKSLGKKDGDILIITTSRLVPKNGIADVIDALRLLPEKFRFLILGIGPLEEVLKKQVTDLHLESRVVFLGQVGHKDLPKYLHLSDIFTRPSLSEGMGISFLEAMAAGLPVVATQEGGIPDFLFDPDRNPEKLSTGLAVNPHDPEALARQFQRLVEEKALREEIIKNAKALVLAKYDWNMIARDMRTEVFLPLLTQSKESPDTL